MTSKKRMRRFVSLMMIAGMIAMALLTGSCGGAGGSSDPEPTPTPDPGVAEQGIWDSIEWYANRGPACPGAQFIGMNLKATIEGDTVYFEWDADVNSIWNYSGDGEYILVHFFRKNAAGNWAGGKFDWIRPGGQGAKGLINVVNGYNGLAPACCGEEVAFAWTNDTGTERTNIAKCIWP